jgi:hypothetical protein
VGDSTTSAKYNYFDHFGGYNIEAECFAKHEVLISGYALYTIEDLKRAVLNLQRSGIGNDLKQSTPTGCGFKSSPI